MATLNGGTMEAQVVGGDSPGEAVRTVRTRVSECSALLTQGREAGRRKAYRAHRRILSKIDFLLGRIEGLLASDSEA